MTNTEHSPASELLKALTWLLDDMEAAGEDRNPETGEEYDSVAFARAAIAKAKMAAAPELLGFLQDISLAMHEGGMPAPELLGLLQDISLAMHEGGMRKPKGWLERIDRTIAKARAA